MDDEGNMVKNDVYVNPESKEDPNSIKIQTILSELVILASSNNISALEVKDTTKFPYLPENYFNLKGMRLFGLPNSSVPNSLSLNFPFLASYNQNGRF